MVPPCGQVPVIIRAQLDSSQGDTPEGGVRAVGEHEAAQRLGHVARQGGPNALAWAAGRDGSGLVLLLAVVLIDVGGWGSIGPQLPEGTFRMIPAEHTAQTWLNCLRAWLIFGLADVTAQPLLQRAFSAKNEQVAQNSFYLAGFGYLTLGVIPVVLGIIASVTMPGLADPETVIPELAMTHLRVSGGGGVRD